MPVLDPAPREDASTARRTDGNDVDLHYLEEARAALRTVMSISHAVSGRATDHDVSALARDALSVQTRQLAAISACLLVWDRPEAARPPTAASNGPAGLPDPMIDRVFADQLTAHAHASITAARAELVAGLSRSARAIAEDAIRSQYRQLAALDSLFRLRTRQRVGPITLDPPQ